MAGARGRGRGRGGGPRSVSQQYLQNSANEAGLDIKNVGRSAAVGIFPDLELHSNGERRLLEHESDLLKEKRNGGKGVGGIGGTEAAAAAVANNGEDTTKVKQEANTSTTSTSTTQDDTSSSNKPKSSKTIYLISKSREMHHKFQNSVFYIRGSTKDVPDVERYSDRKRPPSNIDASDVLSHCLGGKKRTRGVGGGVFVPEELCGGQRRSIANIHDGEEGTTKKIKGGLTIAELAAKEGGMDNNEDDQKPPGAGDDDDIIGDDMPVEDEEDSDGADYTQNYYESDNSGGGSDGEPTY